MKTKPSSEAMAEAFRLSSAILQNIELSEIPLAQISLKASRLARLLNEFEYQRIFQYEAGGYPKTPTGVAKEVWEIARNSGRVYQEKDDAGEVNEYLFLESIEQLEEDIASSKIRLSVSKDPDTAISSANPNQHVYPSKGNTRERQGLHKRIQEAIRKLSGRRTFIYDFALQKNYELTYSGIVSDAFSRIRDSANAQIGEKLPQTVQKFSAVYDNLRSENAEDWSNAVHSCRRILEDLADAIFPAQSKGREKSEGGKKKTINLGQDQYINRIICFVEDHSSSERFEAITGSHIKFLGERLEAILQAAQKGSHSTISTKVEADRYVVYTYMIVADVLSLVETTDAIDGGSAEE